MLTKRSHILVAAIATIFCCLSMIYVSCTKVGGTLACNGVTCENGGYCNDSGFCVCPVGFEGVNCGTASVAKFIGDWDVTSVITGSDSADVIGQQTKYTMAFLTAATPTSFLIQNFLGNPNYNAVIGIIDSFTKTDPNYKNKFSLDTGSFDTHIIGAGLVIGLGSGGTLNPSNNSINAVFNIDRVNSFINREHDTLTLYMTPHHL